MFWTLIKRQLEIAFENCPSKSFWWPLMADERSGRLDASATVKSQQVQSNFPWQTCTGFSAFGLVETQPHWPPKWQKITKESDKADSLHSPPQMCLSIPNHPRIYAVPVVLNQCFICNTCAVVQQFALREVSGRECLEGMPSICNRFN